MAFSGCALLEFLRDPLLRCAQLHGFLHFSQEFCKASPFLHRRICETSVLVAAMFQARQALSAMQAAFSILHGRLPARSTCARFCPTESPWYRVTIRFHVSPLPPALPLLHGPDNGLAALVDGDVLVLHCYFLFSASILFQCLHLGAECPRQLVQGPLG